jgi:hypothetical protein
MEALERQLAELEALSMVFAGEGEYSHDSHAVAIARSLCDAEARSLDSSPLHCLPLEPSPHKVTLDVTLPSEYPGAAPRFEISGTVFSRHDLHELEESVADVLIQAGHAVAKAEGGASAGKGCGAEGRECVLEACLEAQRVGREILQRQRGREQQEQQERWRHEGSSSQPEESGELLLGRRLVWFHHIKSETKRKAIVAMAREAGLRGLSKPGFPGLIAVEGREAAVEDYVSALREMRWQAMEVRWQEMAERLPSAPGAPPPPSLPSPFVELGEGAMGEAAAFCEAARMPFREAILKLRSAEG